jgi:cytidine deaminase
MSQEFEWSSQLSVLRWDELSRQGKDLLKEAVTGRHFAQAPYSKFYVGAAVLTREGNIYRGMNVENANWTATSHAEQNAVNAAIAEEGSGVKVDAIAVVAAPAGTRPNFPPIVDRNVTPDEVFATASALCGHCRQIVWENSHGDTTVQILLQHPSGYIIQTTIGFIFPLAFGPGQLGVEFGI